MKTILSSLLAAVFVLNASPSIAFDAKHLAQLKRTKKCPKCYLRGAVLVSTDLRGANLRDADLRGTQLGHADLSHANLSNANLAGTWFCKTKMRDGKVRNDHC